MTENLIGPDLNRWLRHVQSFEDKSTDAPTPTREEYLGLLIELGYTEDAINEVEETANQLILTAHAYLDADAHEHALEELKSAYGLMPWRIDLVPTLANTFTTQFGKTLSKEHGIAAQNAVEHWINIEPKNPDAYRTLQRLTTHSKRRARRRLIQWSGAVTLSIFTVAVIGHSFISVPKKRTAPSNTETNVTRVPLDPNPIIKKLKTQARQFVLPTGNISVRQPSTQDSAGQTTPGAYSLPVTASSRTPIPGLRLDASESLLTIKSHTDRRHGQLKLRIQLDHAASAPAEAVSVVELKVLVEWLSEIHEVVKSKQLTLVHRDTKLYPGETQSAYQSTFDLPASALYAKLTVTQVVMGTSPSRTPAKKACIDTSSPLAPAIKIDVYVHSIAKSAVVHKALFSIKNRGNDIDTLYAYPKFYNAEGEVIERASKRTILTRKNVASSLSPILRKGEERFVRFASILNPDDRRSIQKVCLELTQDAQLP